MSGDSVNTDKRLQDPETCSDAELLGILLNDAQGGSLDTAAQLLSHYGSLLMLVNAPPMDWQRVARLSDEAAAVLAAALEITRRVKTYRHHEPPTINSADEAAQWVADMRDLAQEHVRLILLDVHNRVIATPTVYIGTLNGVVFRPAEVFREAIWRNSPAFILAHNHPSGDPMPSPEDVELTRVVIAAGKLLDIQVLDHLIIAEQGWRSLKQQGLAF